MAVDETSSLGAKTPNRRQEKTAVMKRNSLSFGLFLNLCLFASGLPAFAQPNFCSTLLDPFQLYTPVEKTTDQKWQQISRSPIDENRKFNLERFYQTRDEWSVKLKDNLPHTDWSNVRFQKIEDQLGFLEALTQSKGVFDLSLENNLSLGANEATRRFNRVQGILEKHQFGWSYLSKNEIQKMSGSIYNAVLGRTGRWYQWPMNGFNDTIDAVMGRAVQERLFRQGVYKTMSEMGLTRDPNFVERAKAFFRNEKVRIALNTALNVLSLQQYKIFAMPLVGLPGLRLDRWIKLSDEELYTLFMQNTGDQILKDLVLKSVGGDLKAVKRTAIYNISSRSVMAIMGLSFVGFFTYNQVTSEEIDAPKPHEPSTDVPTNFVEVIHDEVNQLPPLDGNAPDQGVMSESLWRRYLTTTPDSSAREKQMIYDFIFGTKVK